MKDYLSTTKGSPLSRQEPKRGPGRGYPFAVASSMVWPKRGEKGVAEFRRRQSSRQRENEGMITSKKSSRKRAALARKEISHGTASSNDIKAGRYAGG